MKLTVKEICSIGDLIRRKKVEELTLMSRSTIYRKISLGMFPMPISTGDSKGSRVYWLRSEIESYMKKIINGCTDLQIKEFVDEIHLNRKKIN